MYKGKSLFATQEVLINLKFFHFVIASLRNHGNHS